jgi:hypothetical protein
MKKWMLVLATFCACVVSQAEAWYWGTVSLDDACAGSPCVIEVIPSSNNVKPVAVTIEALTTRNQRKTVGILITPRPTSSSAGARSFELASLKGIRRLFIAVTPPLGGGVVAKFQNGPTRFEAPLSSDEILVIDVCPVSLECDGVQCDVCPLF